MTPLNSFLSSIFCKLRCLYSNVSIGNDFGNFIDKNKPVVFTSENVDPYVCGHQARRCETRISEVYEAAKVPMEIVGEGCKNFEECNSQSHGPLPE